MGFMWGGCTHITHKMSHSNVPPNFKKKKIKQSPRKSFRKKYLVLKSYYA